MHTEDYEQTINYRWSYLSTSDYSWHTMRRFMGVSLKLISDIEKYQFIESVIRGVISMICKSYGKANLSNH